MDTTTTPQTETDTTMNSATAISYLARAALLDRVNLCGAPARWNEQPRDFYFTTDGYLIPGGENLQTAVRYGSGRHWRNGRAIRLPAADNSPAFVIFRGCRYGYRVTDDGWDYYEYDPA